MERDNTRNVFIDFYFRSAFRCHLNKELEERNNYCRAGGLDVIQLFYLRPEGKDELN